MLDGKIKRRDFLKLSAATMATMTLGRSLAFAQPLSLWMNTLFHGGDAQAMERIIQKFNEEQKEQAFISLTQGQWEVYYSQLFNSVVAGNPPQIGICHTTNLPEVDAALTHLEESPAGNLLEVAGIEADNYLPALWEGGVYNGVRYLIPLDSHMWGTWYNRSLFEEAGLDPDNPPDNMEDFEAACNAIMETGKRAFFAADLGAPRHIRRAWCIFLWQMGGELFDEGYTKATFNDDIGVAALDFLVSTVTPTDGKVMGTDTPGKGWNEPGSDGNKQFTAGELGMLWVGNWFYWTAKESGVDFDFHYIPKLFDKRVTWGNSHNLVIPLQASGVSDEVYVAAIKAIKWINENSDIWGIYGGHIPAYKPVFESAELQASDTWKTCLKKFVDMAAAEEDGGLDAFRYDVFHPKISKILAAMDPLIEEAFNGTMSPPDALAQAEENVNAVLAE